jgi:hypothetical protein
VPKGKAALWGDKPSGLLPENCPNFSFFFVWAGTLWALVTSPLRVLKEVPPLRVFKEARPLRVFKEARPDFGKALKGPEKLSHRRERKLSLAVVFPVEDLAVVFSGKVFSPSGGKVFQAHN